MGIKVAINGYGRIGRQVLRAIYDYKIQDQLHFVPFTRNIEIEILPYNKHRGSIGACALAIVAFFIENINVLQDIISN